MYSIQGGLALLCKTNFLLDCRMCWQNIAARSSRAAVVHLVNWVPVLSVHVLFGLAQSTTAFMFMRGCHGCI